MILVRIGLAAALMGLLPSSAWAWWNTSWGLRRKITLNNSGQASNLTDVPLLVPLDSTRVEYFRTQDAGQDIRFVDANDPTMLDYEIELWNEENGAAVWNAGYRGVWHLKEDPAGAPPQMKDSTANVNHGAAEFAPVQTPGQIDGSRSFAPRLWARLRGTLFQGETKKARLELAPLRHDPASGRTVLARRLTVRVEFFGVEPSERSLGGSRGRKARPNPIRALLGVLAQLVVKDPGLYRIRFEDVFPGHRRGVNARMPWSVPSGPGRALSPRARQGTLCSRLQRLIPQ